MAPPPIVTGLSPNEGPPGTRIKIRGENFGGKPSDLIGLTICGMDCLLTAEWKSPNKIIAISGPIKGKGDVIVTTKYGGTGTCNVTFKGYHLATIGPMKESAVWVEETPMYSWGRHSLSPSSFQQEDPLGLSVEETENKISEEDLQAYFPGKCGDIGSQNFSPAWFLLENHQATSFNDLKAGLVYLTRKVQSQKEGQLSFLKANLNSVMDQIDTLINLREKFEQDASVFGSTPTIKLERAIKESEREARKLFDDVLTRKDRAEKTRNALNVLHRYKFLFCLPCVIERNIKKGDYDIVINDYMRVKNLFDKTEVPIFREALNEVEKRIFELQTKLHKDLQTMPITVEQQKRLIRHLVNLDCPFDAAWDAIKSRWEHINQKFKEIYDFHKSTDKSENTKKQNSASKYTKSQIDVNVVPACVNFTDEICAVTSEIFPDFWKIGLAYFSGELQVKIEAGRQVEYKHMVLTAIEYFSKYVRASIIPNTLDKSERIQYGSLSSLERDEVALYLPELLRSVRSTYSTLIQLDLPNEALDIIAGLLIDLRIHCMSILFQKTCEQIKQLPENWKISFSGKHTGVTDLPLEFLRLIEDVIQIVKESALSAEQRESSLLENPSARKELEKQVDNILSAFYDVLNDLSSTEDYDDCNDSSPVVSQLIGTPVGSHKSGPCHDIPAWENRLLITLSNCMFTKTTVLDHICKKFKETGFTSIETPIKTNRNNLEMLEKSILDKYLEQKSDPLVGTIEPSMYLGRFDWDINITPTDIRPYAKECINNLINVHLEIINVSTNLLDIILIKIVETIAEELYRLMSCVQKFSKEGAQQAMVDLEVLQEIFQDYLSDNAKGHFEEAFAHVPKLEKSDLTLVEDILKQSRVKMKNQVLCLRKIK
ncbi:exocyst complex component 2 [Diorhabda carinulata]|uniref:exocyst complex component 2 n=1 Tax=Diorhabda carinulata TaxID=1163345 RepID=UPI0025A03E09|nr:exocyst complex component 2 [Diorhabda carinulata]